MQMHRHNYMYMYIHVCVHKAEYIGPNHLLLSSQRMLQKAAHLLFHAKGGE